MGDHKHSDLKGKEVKIEFHLVCYLAGYIGIIGFGIGLISYFEKVAGLCWVHVEFICAVYLMDMYIRCL